MRETKTIHLACFIPDGPLIHIGTIYFSMIFISERSFNAFNGDT